MKECNLLDGGYGWSFFKASTWGGGGFGSHDPLLRKLLGEKQLQTLFGVRGFSKLQDLHTTSKGLGASFKAQDFNNSFGSGHGFGMGQVPVRSTQVEAQSDGSPLEDEEPWRRKRFLWRGYSVSPLLKGKASVEPSGFACPFLHRQRHAFPGQSRQVD